MQTFLCCPPGDLDTMDLFLEDDTHVSPFELSNKVLEAGGSQLDYLTKEYCHRITTDQLKPLEADQVTNSLRPSYMDCKFLLFTFAQI